MLKTLGGMIAGAVTIGAALLGLLKAEAQAPPPTSIRERDVAVPHARRCATSRRHPPPVAGTCPDTRLSNAVRENVTRSRNDTTFTRAVERGYAVVVQDVRGRYASDGEFRPYEHEGRDGYDTIEWAARQPWSNGRVGTFGLSYPGAVQWLAAVENPPHLEAMVPAMTFSTPQNFFYSGGIWDLSWVPWIWTSIAADARARLKRRRPSPTNHEDVPGWNAVKEKMLGTLPLDQLEELRDIAPYYYDWLHHPPEDPFWNFAELRNKYGRTRAAVLNLSGWHDDNYGPEGAITNYLGLVRVARRETVARSAPARPVGARRRRDRADEVRRTRVRSRRRHRLRRGRPRVDGSLSPGRPRASNRPTRYGISSWATTGGGRPTPGRREAAIASTICRPLAKSPGRGTLTVDATDAGKIRLSTFVSDPDDPVINPYESAGVHDYQALAKRSDVLTFDSAPLARDTDVTGPIRARDLHLVRLPRYRPVGAAARRRAGRRRLQSDESGTRRRAGQLSRSRQRAPAAHTRTRLRDPAGPPGDEQSSFCAATGCGSRSPPPSFRTSRATSTPATSRPCRRAGNGRRSGCTTTAHTRRRCRCMSWIGDFDSIARGAEASRR